MRTKPILVLGGALLVALAALRLATDSTAVEQPPRARIEPPIVESAPARRAEVRSAPASTSPTISRTEAEEVAHETDLLVRIEQDLQQRLRDERVDPAWAPTAERAIANTVGDARFTGLRAEKVICGRTMCRVGLTATAQVENVQGLVDELTSTPAFRHGGFMRFTDARTVTMFIAREGHTLPRTPRG